MQSLPRSRPRSTHDIGAPVVAAVALDVLRTIAEPDFLAEVRSKGEWFGGA